jgi:hypothetical protein
MKKKKDHTQAIAKILSESWEGTIRTVINSIRTGEELDEETRVRVQRMADNISEEDYRRIGIAKLQAAEQEKYPPRTVNAQKPMMCLL